MAAQMAVALTGAFAVGHWLLPGHWLWVVLTAYIVCSGNRGRADVIDKGLMRLVGASVGTVVATIVIGVFPAGDGVTVVVIFVVLAFAVWLRPINYAYWAGCVTAVIALLYGYFGEGGIALLRTRLEGILLGAVIGAAASWLVLPIKSGEVLRRREADALRSLSDVVTSTISDPTQLAVSSAGFDYALRQLDEVMRAFRLRSFIDRRARTQWFMDVARVLHRCSGAQHRLSQLVTADHTVLDDQAFVSTAELVLDDVKEIRRCIADSSGSMPILSAPATGSSPVTQHDMTDSDGVTRLFFELHGELSSLITTEDEVCSPKP
jgi:uncharacterized membrane protein YccC